jgi:hypothetical protein
MSEPAVSPEPILQVAAGLWAAGVLKSSVELQLCDALAAGPQDVAALSQALGAAPLSLRVVLDALVALGVVSRQAQGYTLPGQPDSTFSWLFSVMIHATRGGRSFSAAEIRQMLTECGAIRTEVGGGLPVGFVVGHRR